MQQRQRRSTISNAPFAFSVLSFFAYFSSKHSVTFAHSIEFGAYSSARTNTHLLTPKKEQTKSSEGMCYWSDLYFVKHKKNIENKMWMLQSWSLKRANRTDNLACIEKKPNTRKHFVKHFIAIASDDLSLANIWEKLKWISTWTVERRRGR